MAAAKKTTTTEAAATKTTAAKAAAGFTDDERAAMKERAAEVRAARGKGAKADDEAGLLAKIAEMPEPDRGLATAVHRIVRATAPALTCRTWYGMPAYARDGKVVCFFQTYAVLEMTPEVEERLAALVERAVG